MLFFSKPVHLVFGLIIWSLWFALMYALLSIGCAIDPVISYPLNWISLMLLCFMIITLGLLLYLMYTFWKTCSPKIKNTPVLGAFVHWVGLGVYVTAVIATFSIGIMVLFFPPCL